MNKFKRPFLKPKRSFRKRLPRHMKRLYEWQLIFESYILKFSTG